MTTSVRLHRRTCAFERQDVGIYDTYDLEHKVSDWERTLSDEKSDISNRIYNGNQCVGYREEVASVFNDAKQNAKSESDPEIKPYADKLVAYWESEESGHATSIRTYKDAIEKCKAMR